ncbi:hypothetical protein BH11PAT4_BH11PAT4_1770 [soil metagenome]
MKRRYVVLSAVFMATSFGLVAAATATVRSFEYLTVGIQQLQRGQSLMLSNPDEAQQAFSSASASFKISSGILVSSPWYGKLFTPLPPFRWHVQAMQASKELSRIGVLTTELSQSFPPISLEQPDVSTILSQGSSQFVTWEARESGKLDELVYRIGLANDKLEDLPTWVFFSKRDTLLSLRENLSKLERVIPEFRTASTELQRVLGKYDEQERKVVIFFQNSAELRPCGGFPGSYAFLNTQRGSIKSFSFGTNFYKFDRIYEKQNGLIPPVPVQTIAAFHGYGNACTGDGFLSTYSPRTLQMFSDSSQTKPVGAIFLNSSILSELLTITGPITLPNGAKASSETIGKVLTTEIERDYFKAPENIATNEPKTILNDLIPILFKRLATVEGSGVKLATIFQEAVRAKELQLWFTDSALQASLAPLTPRDQPEAKKPWVKLVNTNLAGMKSSEKTLQNTRISVAKPLFGNLATYTLEIERTHTGDGVWPDAINRNYLEAYLPREAEVVENPKPIGGDYTIDGGLLAQNNLFTVDQAVVRIEEGPDWKRVGWWATTPIGGLTSYRLKFTLPTDTYSPDALTYLKQSGSRDTLQAFGKSYPVSTNLYLKE